VSWVIKLGKIWLIVGLSAAILFGSGIRVGVCADFLAPGKKVTKPGIFFDVPTSIRLLEEIESCRSQQEELDVCQALDRVNRQLEKVREEREKLLMERIEFLERTQTDLIRLNDQAIKTADSIRKESRSSLVDRGLKMIGIIALSVLVGLAL
jgi:hypothetical protein